MKIKARTVAVVAACTLAACGCSSHSTRPPAQETENRIEFTPLSPDIVSPYYGGLGTPSYRIVRSRGEWVALWRELEPRTSREQGQLQPNPVPQIDFDRHALLVAAMGGRPSGGYWIEVESLKESADRIVATVVEQSPGANCTVTAIVTYPIAILLVSKTAKQVEFEVLRKTHECG